MLAKISILYFNKDSQVIPTPSHCSQWITLPGKQERHWVGVFDLARLHWWERSKGEDDIKLQTVLARLLV